MITAGKPMRGGALGLIAALAIQPVFSERLIMQQQVMLGDWGGDIIWNGPIAAPADSGNSHLTEGFSVAADGTDLQDTPAGQAIALMQAGDWLKAIEAIESLSSADQRLVTDPNGILRPLSTLKSALLASMPEQGRRTFRKLNNPAASTKLEQAKQLTDLSERESAYQTLVRDYALCDAAAEAANTLGDLRFEQGRFDEAAMLYRFAAEHPASTTDDALLMAKRLYALSRAGLWEAFNDLVEYAEFRHGDTAVALGGREITLRKLIQELSKAKGADPAGPVRGDTAPLAMPSRLRTSFEQELIDPAIKQSLEIQAMNNRMGGLINDLVLPVVACDNDRLFILALGSVARIDPQTGSEIWRAGQEPSKHVQSIGNRMHQMQQGYHQALVIADGTLLCVEPKPNYPNRSSLVARDAETGEERWNTTKNSDLRKRGIVGEPLVVDDRVYAVTQQPGEGQTKLATLSLETGSLINQIDLGSAPIDSNLNAPVELSPRLTMGQGFLFVQTNNGALIAIDPIDMTVAWAFTQKIRTSAVGLMRRRGIAVPNALAQHTGDVVAYNGMVIAKDTRSNTVHAFREYDASLVWSHSTDADATIVHIDRRHVYVLGEELVAHDLRTGERVWWTPHAGNESGTPVFTDDACLIAGSQRLCRVDLATGKLTDYDDQMFNRADLAVVGNRLIRATRDRVSSYRLDHPKPN